MILPIRKQSAAKRFLNKEAGLGAGCFLLGRIAVKNIRTRDAIYY